MQKKKYERVKDELQRKYKPMLVACQNLTWANNFANTSDYYAISAMADDCLTNIHESFGELISFLFRLCNRN